MATQIEIPVCLLSHLKAGVVWNFADRLRRKKQNVIPAGLLWFIFYGYSVKVYRTE